MISLVNLLSNSQPHFLLQAPSSSSNNMAKRGTFDSTQVLELILQDGSDNETEVDHYESSNESVKDEDFLDDVPEIDDDPDCLSDEDGEINNEMRPDTTDADSSVLSVFFINCLNLCTVLNVLCCHTKCNINNMLFLFLFG